VRSSPVISQFQSTVSIQAWQIRLMSSTQEPSHTNNLHSLLMVLHKNRAYDGGLRITQPSNPKGGHHSRRVTRYHAITDCFCRARKATSTDTWADHSGVQDLASLFDMDTSYNDFRLPHCWSPITFHPHQSNCSTPRTSCSSHCTCPASP
jgi:hypothetical protein